MESKKYSLFIGILCLLASASYAQVGTAYDVLDSSLISTKKLPQFNEFRNNAYPFPPKPRNQWEIGVKGGIVTINGDVPAVFPTGGFGVHVRKALGYVVSLRLEYMYGIGKGLSWKPRTGGFSRPFLDAGYSVGSTTTGVVYDNYKTTVQDLSLESVFTLNNINFNKAKTNVVFYALAGVGATLYDAKVDARNGTGGIYNYGSIQGGVYDNKKDTKDALKNLQDEKYESSGEVNNERELFGSSFSPSLSAGLGVAFRLGKRVNLAIEDRLIVPFTDLLDGQRYQNARGINNSNILSPNSDNINYLTVGLNFNLGSRSTEPLWWMNPLDYAYSELNAPKHMKFPKPILDDADADGITDQFDHEPNTPANAPVDSHGVSRDTDGDGVPDYKDKELVTPTQCQPVDADGVGKCPEPACCTTLDSLIKAGGIRPACNLGSLPSISFKGRSSALSNDAKAVLAGVAETLKNSPSCKVAVVGYGESSKSAQQTSWDRVNAVINYLVEKEGISADRFIFKYGETGGDNSTVDLKDGSNDEGPNTVPAPHPNLRKK
jgi:outer membrane protein OmpA-like peptidoglycan-associated protein